MSERTEWENKVRNCRREVEKNVRKEMWTEGDKYVKLSIRDEDYDRQER